MVIPSLLGLLLAPLAPGPAAVAAAPPSVWVESGYDHVFSSSVTPSRPGRTVDLAAARNETQAAQIAVRSGSALSGLRVAAGDLTGPGGATIPASRITVDREYNHPRIDKVVQSGPSDGHQEPPDGGTSYYDALVGNEPYALAPNTTQPYYYSVAVPAGQAPGTYTGKATVQSADGAVDVPVAVTVYDTELPPTNRSTFRMNNWFTSVGWDYDWTAASIPGQYGVQPYEENWWKVIESFAADHAKHRNNVIYADFQALALRDTKLDGNGQYTFQWGDFDRFVQTFQNAGALQYIYTPTLIEEGGSRLEALVSDGRGGVRKDYLPVDTPQGRSTAAVYLDKVFGALKAHLDTKCLDPGPVPACAPGRRWSDAFYMSAVDEPAGTSLPVQSVTSPWLYQQYRAKFPQGLTNEAHVQPVSAVDSALGTVTPKLDGPNYDQNAGYYQSLRLAGKDLWLYYCNDPRDRHVNRFISYPVADSRLTPWMVAAAEGDGFLHWGWNIWSDDSPSHPAYDTKDGWQNGDRYLVRPNAGTPANPKYELYDSVRSEALLAGAQDFELLHRLAAVKPVLTRALIGSLITSTTEFSTSGVETDHRHRQILEALTSGGPDAAFPFSDDFSAGDDGQWRHTKGNWSVTDGGYVQSDPLSSWETVSAVAGRAYGDVSASVDVRITGVNPTGGNSNWAGLTVHSQNPTDVQTGYLVALRNNGEVFVYRSGTSLATAKVPGYTPGQTVTLRVVTRGSALKVFAGTTPLITLDDPGYPAGNIGLVTGDAAARFDNVRLDPGTDAAAGAAATASSSYEADGWGLAAVTDGRRGLPDGSTGWSSIDNLTADHSEWVSVDLGAVRRIGRVDLHPRADGANTGLGFPVDFTVQVSADDVTWTTVADRKDYPRPDASAQPFAFPATDVRYVRVTGTRLRTDPHGNYHMQLAEIETAGGDLAVNRPVQSSSSLESSGWRRAAATDGVLNSALGYSMGWTSAKSPTATANEWLAVDLQSANVISQVQLVPRTDGANTGLGFPVDYTVQVSADNAAWTTVASRTGQPRPGAAGQTFTFTPATARYVRIVATRLSPDQFGDHYLQLGEVTVS
ncbi:discoidin domain-containing protein [Kitasatospora sp. SolWspMP-SS2h]|uniref:discoidin domain-containing protein n=1 Tax=Kitasatospora sp. SolWspMP-SS2h TaxID=1305729 RepID=UPI0011B947DF|nr:discoidin domain-containing protein [Kitasatospora sp. SolWspMP-SS2h]